MGTVTLDNGVQVRQVLNFYYLAIKPTIYTDVPNYTVNHLTIYPTNGSPPNYIQAVYKSYQQGVTSDILTLWYTSAFSINGNQLIADIPINYSISGKSYNSLIGPFSSNVPQSELIGVNPTTAGSLTDTADRIYFPHWKVGTVDYQNKFYIMKRPIVNRVDSSIVTTTGDEFWQAIFNTSNPYVFQG